MQTRLEFWFENTPTHAPEWEVGETKAEKEFEAPCDRKCWYALHDECICRCGGVNHGVGWRLNAKLDEIDGVAE